MTGYQRAKIVGLWLKAGKPMPLDEFAATIDIKTINDPNPIIKAPEPEPEQQDLLDNITKIFPGAVQLRVK